MAPSGATFLLPLVLAFLCACGDDDGINDAGRDATTSDAPASDAPASDAPASDAAVADDAAADAGGDDVVWTDNFDSYALGTDGATEAVLDGPWTAVLAGGDDVTELSVELRPAKVAVQISSEYARSGGNSVMVDMGMTGESVTGLSVMLPPDMVEGGYELEWYELRSADYDWAGEKSIRFHSETIGVDADVGGYDYFIGWQAAEGFGTSDPMDDGGPLKFVANSRAAQVDGNNEWSLSSYAMPREEWHQFRVRFVQGEVGGISLFQSS